MKSCLVLAILFAAQVLPGAEIKPIHKLPVAERAARLQTDAPAALLYREGLHAVNRFLATQPEIFPVDKPPPAALNSSWSHFSTVMNEPKAPARVRSQSFAPVGNARNGMC
jgi:hypothetical protein